jgi:hypothetical protein
LLENIFEIIMFISKVKHLKIISINFIIFFQFYRNVEKI